MIARATAELPISAERVFELAVKTQLQLHLSGGFFSYRDELPPRREEGYTVATRLKLFGVVPVWKHEQHFRRVDPSARVILVEERGGPYRRWDHLMRIEERSTDSCRWIDEIDVEAGVFTAGVWLFARTLVNARMRRMARVARLLA